MRPTYETIELPANTSLRVRYARGRRFSHHWHFHPEIELFFVERSRGMRIVGDSVGPFREGELVLMGPGLPHVWTNYPSEPDQLGYARGFLVQFREDFLGAQLWRAPELAPVNSLLLRARHGLLFKGAVAREAAMRVRHACKLVGLPRLLHVFSALDLLAHTREFVVLSSGGYVPKLRRDDAARINLVCRYVDEHLAEEISQTRAAALLRMRPNSFSRFFRLKLGRTFSSYVNELRIARAIHLMVEEEMSVSEACYASGFNNLSNFNRRFRALKGVNPRTYLENLQSAQAATPQETLCVSPP